MSSENLVFIDKVTPWKTGPFNSTYCPPKPIHFEPPRDILKFNQNQYKKNPWVPSTRSVSNTFYKQSMDFIDKQPPLPIPKYKRFIFKKIEN
jgi:hypothetical protein